MLAEVLAAGVILAVLPALCVPGPAAIIVLVGVSTAGIMSVVPPALCVPSSCHNTSLAVLNSPPLHPLSLASGMKSLCLPPLAAPVLPPQAPPLHLCPAAVACCVLRVTIVHSLALQLLSCLCSSTCSPVPHSSSTPSRSSQEVGSSIVGRKRYLFLRYCFSSLAHSLANVGHSRSLVVCPFWLQLLHHCLLGGASHCDVLCILAHLAQVSWICLQSAAI
jgi:hypothetical protein